ncbi:MAG: Fe-S protein assembly co-chaperone HscB [Gammaproteobacteria bacterium AqS3]|nr:Fe-S protein assembly co-chaperone HscB [Gammaproteobacteria bacterium AqS3]
MPEHERSHFELLGLAERWAIDPDALKRSYLKLQRQFHPDRLGALDPALRRSAERRSIAINEAHRVLSDAIKRARHLLQLRGLVTAEEGTVNLPEAFLLEQLELRERAAQKGEDLARLAERVAGDWDALGRAFDAALEAGDLTGAEAVFHRMQFVNKLRIELERSRQHRQGNESIAAD